MLYGGFLMRSTFHALFSSAILIAGLAACGGGGGGSTGSGGGVFTPPVPTSTPVAKSYTLTARCSGCSHPSMRMSSRFRDTLSSRSPRDASPSPSPSPTPGPVLNTGSIPQFVLFSTPDTYTHGTAPISNQGFTLFAYLDTSNGSSAPNPLPTASWTKNGPSLVDAVVDPTTVAGVPANTLKPGFAVSAPTTPGQTIYEASAIGQFAPFYVNTYYALGVSSDPHDPHNYNACLKFNLAGIAEQVSSNCDVSIDSSGIYVGTAGVFLPTTSMPIQSDSTGYTAQQTSLPLDYNTVITLTGSGANISYLAHLADGRYAMLYMQSFATVPGGAAGHEQIQVMFAPYKVSDTNGHFAY